MARKIRNADELKKAIEEDDLQDKLASPHHKMSVREYARAKRIQPQLVYYYIRRGYIKEEACGECGRKVIDVESAEEYFALRDSKDPRQAKSGPDAD